MDKDNFIKYVMGKKYVKCPTCQGTGLCEEITISVTDQVNNSPLINDEFKEKNINNNFKKSSSLETVDESDESSKEVNFQDLSLIMDNFLEDTKKLKNLSEPLKVVLQKLKEENCDSNLSALENILCLCKYDPAIIESSMSVVYRKLSSLLQNTRLQVVTSSAHLATKFFETTKYAHRPEFDELGFTLLLKSAHMNKKVKELSNEALNAMILNIPPWHCVRVLTSVRGSGHKNPEVRATVSRLLDGIVNVIGVKNLLFSPNFKEIRHKILITLAEFLIDGCYKTRVNAKKLIKLLMTHNEFENCFSQDIDLKLFRKIEKDFIALKYE